MVPMRAKNGVGAPREPRSSRRKEAHSISAEGSWSLLTSAATTVQGRNRLKGGAVRLPSAPYHQQTPVSSHQADAPLMKGALDPS